MVKHMVNVLNILSLMGNREHTGIEHCPHVVEVSALHQDMASIVNAGIKTAVLSLWALLLPTHEVGSEMMLEKLTNDNGFDTHEVKFLKCLLA